MSSGFGLVALVLDASKGPREEDNMDPPQSRKVKVWLQYELVWVLVRCWLGWGQPEGPSLQWTMDRQEGANL